MLAKVQSAAVIGLEAVPIEVEVDIASMGLPSFAIVGLPDKAVEEAKERVRAAIKNSGAEFPAKRITVNLAPGDIPKEGTHFDLPIAIGILIASGQLQADLASSLFLGELALNGNIRPVTGVLPMTYVAREHEMAEVFVPQPNAPEAHAVTSLTGTVNTSHIAIYPVAALADLAHHFTRTKALTPFEETKTNHAAKAIEIDMADIRGQEHAKRAAEISAAGGHNMAMQGPPGTGKTMLARALSAILPAMTSSEVLEVTKIYSICGLLTRSEPLIYNRPFRSPHHTISQIGLVGGGSRPKPGEISLSHRGILFLDEFPQFTTGCIEALRAPLEDGIVTVTRAQQALTFPAQFMLITAQNPCPCGYLGDPRKECTCTATQIFRYQKRISGPMADRIDLHIDVPRVDIKKLTQQTTHNEGTKAIRARVQKAREMQITRFKNTHVNANAEMGTDAIQNYCALDQDSQQFLRAAIERLSLSARSYHRVLKVARTIADLAHEKHIAKEHVAEALQYRHRPGHLS